MKILDRYIIATFLKNYLIAFMVLVGLYVVLDMIFNLDEFAQVREDLDAGGFESAIALARGIGSYYFYQMFLFYAHLSAIIPVVAAAFTMLRFSRFNEVIAVLAAGVPMLRIAAPIILVGVGLNALLVIDQELILPRIINKLDRRHDQVHLDTGQSFSIEAMRDRENRLLYVGLYHPPGRDAPARMEQVDIIERDERYQPLSHILAEGAQWDPAASQWRLIEGRRVRGLAADQRRGPEEPVEVYRSNITPDEIALFRSGETVELLSTRRINQLLERPQSYGTADLLRVKHSRFTLPLANVIVLMLAMSCVLTREPQQLKSAAMKCLGITAVAIGSIFLFHNLAGFPPPGEGWANRWAALMAWMPILIFGPIAVWMLDRVRT